MDRCQYHDDLVSSISDLRADIRELGADLRNSRETISEAVRRISDMSGKVALHEGASGAVWKMVGVAIAAASLSAGIFTLILKVVAD